MHSSKRRRGSEKQGAGASSSRVEDCSLLTPLSGVVTDWCEDDEEIPTNVTVAAAIAAITPRQVFARQRVRATLATEAAEEQSTKRSKNDQGVRESAHGSPDNQLDGKGDERAEPHLAPGPTGGSENTNGTQSLADAEVSGLSDGKTDATDQEVPLATSTSPLTQRLPSAVHALASSGIDFNDGLVLIVEKSVRSRRNGSIDDDDDDPEDEDYVDDGKGADGEDGDGDDDDADDDDDEEGGRQDADDEDERHLATLRNELGESHHTESVPVQGPIIISLLDSPIRKQAS